MNFVSIFILLYSLIGTFAFKVNRLNDFSQINKLCDKVHVKLCAIFTNKLFPNIMPNDIPPQKEVQNAVQDATQNVDLTV